MDPNGGINPSSPRLDTNPAATPSLPPEPIPAPAAVPTTDPYQAAPPAAPAQPASSWQQPAVDLLQMPPVDTTTLPPAGPGKAKLILLIVLGVVIALSLVAGAWFVGYSNGKSAGRNAALAEFQAQEQLRQEEEAALEEEVMEETVNQTLELGPLKEPEYKDETVEGEIGQQLSNADGFVLKVTNVERNFQPNDPNYQADPTKELVKVNFLMGNVAKDKPFDITPFSFRLVNASNAQLTPETNIAEYEGKFDTVKIDPGSQSKGSIVYVVTKDEKPLNFTREQRYRITGQNREVTEKIVVGVVKP